MSKNGATIFLGKNATNIKGLSDYVQQNAKDANESIEIIGPLAKINLLVGANNAGKSRFMRAVMNADYYVIANDLSSLTTYNSILNLMRELKDLMKNSSISFSIAKEKYDKRHLSFLNNSHSNLYDKDFTQNVTINYNYVDVLLNDLEDLFNKPKLKSDPNLIIEQYKDYMSIAKEIIERRISGSWPLSTTTINTNTTIDYNSRDKLVELFDELAKLLSLLENKINIVSVKGKIYIPILRAARTLLTKHIEGNIENGGTLIPADTFAQTVIQTYEINPEKVEIHTGLDLYGKIIRARNANKENRILFDKFEQFISDNFFQGKEFEIVAQYPETGQNEHLYISINGVEHEIHFLGDGIQSLIMLLYPLFLAKPNSWVFIEEPEVHMHPGMQRLFIQTILNDETINKKDLTIFLTTHSNHLFDIAIENQEKVAVFGFQKIQENPSRFTIAPTTSGQLAILDLLEVSNSSVFMANCAVWVEGPTDRIYVRKYLNEYVKEYYEELTLHEDLEYCFFEYAGSNLSHYVFSQPDDLPVDVSEKINAWFLSNRIFLIADSDSGKNKKHQDLLKQQNSNFIYYPLDVREVENLLSPKFISEHLPSIFLRWSQESRNEWAVQMMNNPLIHSEYIGKYFASFLTAKYSSIKFPEIVGGSGTLATFYKNKLAQHAELTIEWKNMSQEARSLAKSVFEFIAKSNPLLSKLLAKHLKPA